MSRCADPCRHRQLGRIRPIRSRRGTRRMRAALEMRTPRICREQASTSSAMPHRRRKGTSSRSSRSEADGASAAASKIEPMLCQRCVSMFSPARRSPAPSSRTRKARARRQSRNTVRSVRPCNCAISAKSSPPNMRHSTSCADRAIEVGELHSALSSATRSTMSDGVPTRSSRPVIATSPPRFRRPRARA